MGVPFIAHHVYSKTAANQNVIPLHLLFSITTNLILPKVSPFKSCQSVLSTLVTAAVGEYVSFFWKYIFMLSNGFVMRSIMFYKGIEHGEYENCLNEKFRRKNSLKKILGVKKIPVICWKINVLGNILYSP